MSRPRTGRAGKARAGAPRVYGFDSPAALEGYMVERWREACLASGSERGRMDVAVSGGRTPIGFFRALAARGQDLPWALTHVFQVDERFVPPDDRLSNLRMLRQNLLSAVPIPEANVHAVDTDAAGPEEAAWSYEQDLARHFQLAAGQFPRFDLVLLGLGENGHTASLFPDAPALCETRRLVREVRLLAPGPDRVTLTYPVINRARRIVFLVEGSAKAETLRRVVEDKDPTLPAVWVKPRDGELAFLADRDAAASLSRVFYVRPGAKPAGPA
jgi:6-phosphogluconolactonase